VNTKIKKILVTGGGGFLGSYIVEELLSRNYEVFSFSRKAYPELTEKGVTCLTGSLDNYSDVENALTGVDAVIHTAALAGIWGKWEDFYNTNFIGSKNIVKACESLNITHLVYTSSPSVVFDGKSLTGEGEELPYAKKHWSHYPVTKAMAEKHVLDSNSKTLKTSALRPHLIWGPKDPHFIPRLVERAKTGKLKQIGDGENLVDVIYVENAAKAHVDLLETLVNDPSRVEGKVYFIGQDKPVKLWEFVNGLIDSAGGKKVSKKIPLWLGYFAGFLMEFIFKTFRVFKKEPLLTRFLVLQLAKSHYFSHKNAEKDFGYKAHVSSEEGFKKLKHYYS
jgi:nucleoside-diphosphate-sugar epimerase